MVFEQQPRESDKAFAAFGLYLSLGPQRSMAMTQSMPSLRQMPIRSPTPPSGATASTGTAVAPAAPSSAWSASRVRG